MRLTEQISNRKFLVSMAKLLADDEPGTSTQAATEPACACGCQQPVAPGRRFINQAHYDRSKGLAAAEAEQLVARFHRGVPKKQLAREYGVALTTVKRLLKQTPTT